MSLRARLERARASFGAGDGRCPECRLEPSRTHVFYPGEGEEAPEPTRCPNCGRLLGVVLRVEYEGGEGGGGHT